MDGRAGDLNAVWADYEADPAFAHLRLPGIRFVPGDGPADASVFIVGEAPGPIENGAGRPFVGPSGRVLDILIGHAGWAREAVYVTNVVKYLPPGMRTPDRAELDGGRAYLRREWGIVRPVLTVAVGRVARLALVGSTSTRTLSVAPRGELHPFGESGWFTHQYHPAYGLRKGQKMLDSMADDWKVMGDEFRERTGA